MGYLAQIRELKLILMYAVVSGHLLARVMCPGRSTNNYPDSDSLTQQGHWGQSKAIILMVVCMLDPIVRPPLVCLLWVEGVSGVSPPPYGCWPTAFDCTVHLVGKPVQ